jgi:hydroxymethylglutaryl-CoA reductase
MNNINNMKKHQNYIKKMETAKTKTELAKELGINIPKDGYWGDIPSRVCGTVGGAIGGNMVKSAIEQYEKNLVEETKK